MLELEIVLAALYGVTMKVADLLNEHGLKWFKHSDILFGFLWGTFGALLVMTDTIVASGIVAMNVAFIARGRLDYRNHQIASAIIISAGIISASLLSTPFAPFLIIFIIFGSLKDYADDVLHAKGFLASLNEQSWYYPIPTFIYCLMFGHWMLFWVFTVYILAYNTVKAVARNRGYP